MDNKEASEDVEVPERVWIDRHTLHREKGGYYSRLHNIGPEYIRADLATRAVNSISVPDHEVVARAVVRSIEAESVYTFREGEGKRERIVAIIMEALRGGAVNSISPDAPASSLQHETESCPDCEAQEKVAWAACNESTRAGSAYLKCEKHRSPESISPGTEEVAVARECSRRIINEVDLGGPMLDFEDDGNTSPDEDEMIAIIASALREAKAELEAKVTALANAAVRDLERYENLAAQLATAKADMKERCAKVAKAEGERSHELWKRAALPMPDTSAMKVYNGRVLAASDIVAAIRALPEEEGEQDSR